MATEEQRKIALLTRRPVEDIEREMAEHERTSRQGRGVRGGNVVMCTVDHYSGRASSGSGERLATPSALATEARQYLDDFIANPGNAENLARGAAMVSAALARCVARR